MKWLLVLAAVILTALLLKGSHPVSGTAQMYYPNPKLTPGKVATTNLSDLTRKYDGQTYSQANRNVTAAEKAQVCKEYTCTKPYEVDHFIPLALGGTNDLANLWAEPGTGQWNFHVKDQLEAYLARQVKAGVIPVKTAQSCIQKDWVACYKTYFSTKLGSTQTVEFDTDDEITQ